MLMQNGYILLRNSRNDVVYNEETGYSEAHTEWSSCVACQYRLTSEAPVSRDAQDERYVEKHGTILIRELPPKDGDELALYDEGKTQVGVFPIISRVRLKHVGLYKYVI